MAGANGRKGEYNARMPFNSRKHRGGARHAGWQDSQDFQRSAKQAQGEVKNLMSSQRHGRRLWFAGGSQG